MGPGDFLGVPVLWFEFVLVLVCFVLDLAGVLAGGEPILCYPTLGCCPAPSCPWQGCCRFPMRLGKALELCLASRWFWSSVGAAGLCCWRYDLPARCCWVIMVYLRLCCVSSPVFLRPRLQSIIAMPEASEVHVGFWSVGVLSVGSV